MSGLVALLDDVAAIAKVALVSVKDVMEQVKGDRVPSSV